MTRRNRPASLIEDVGSPMRQPPPVSLAYLGNVPQPSGTDCRERSLRPQSVSRTDMPVPIHLGRETGCARRIRIARWTKLPEGTGGLIEEDRGIAVARASDGASRKADPIGRA